MCDEGPWLGDGQSSAPTDCTATGGIRGTVSFGGSCANAGVAVKGGGGSCMVGESMAERVLDAALLLVAVST